MSQNLNVTLNAAVTEAVTKLAKSRKISSAALMEAAKIALAMQPTAAPRATRQAGETSTKFRNEVVEKYEEKLKGQKLTFGDVAKMFNIDPANATNNLKWLKEHAKINYVEVGFGEKAPGTRGRAPVLVEFQ